MKIKTLFAVVLGTAQIYAAQLTPNNVVVVQCDGTLSSGNAGALVEYSPSGGTAVQTIALPNIFFSGSFQLNHDIGLSADRGLVLVPAFSMTAANVDDTQPDVVPRVIAAVKWDGTLSYYTNSGYGSGATKGYAPRGITGDGFGQYWGTYNSGMQYMIFSDTATAPMAVSGGVRAPGIFNGHLYATTSAGIRQATPDFPTSGGLYVAYVANMGTYAAGFAVPPGPTTGSKAYIGHYSTTNAIHAFNWNGSAWDAGYVIKPSNIGGYPEHIAVDYSNLSAPIIYFTTTVGDKLYKFVDSTGAASTTAADVIATATGNFRGVAMAATQPALPVFTAQPSGATVNYGDTITLGPVAADGANPYKWQWKKGSIVLADGGRISGATTTQLLITGAMSGDEGNYYAVAVNNGGERQSDAAVVALAGSCITPPLASHTNAAGTTAVFHANVGSCLGPITGYSWTKSGGTIGDGETGTGSGYLGATTDTLTVTNVGPSDEGLYMVTVAAGNGPNSSAATLTVVVTPSISQPPYDVDVAAGRTTNADRLSDRRLAYLLLVQRNEHYSVDRWSDGQWFYNFRGQQCPTDVQ